MCCCCMLTLPLKIVTCLLRSSIRCLLLTILVVFGSIFIFGLVGYETSGKTITFPKENKTRILPAYDQGYSAPIIVTNKLSMKWNVHVKAGAIYEATNTEFMMKGKTYEDITESLSIAHGSASSMSAKATGVRRGKIYFYAEPSTVDVHIRYSSRLVLAAFPLTVCGITAGSSIILLLLSCCLSMNKGKTDNQRNTAPSKMV